MRELKRTRRSWKLYFAVTFSLLLPLLVISCGQKQIPVWTGKIYSVDTENTSFVRSQDNESIEIKGDTRDWIAMTAEDFELFVQVYVVGCDSYQTSPTLVPIEKQIKEGRP